MAHMFISLNNTFINYLFCLSLLILSKFLKWVVEPRFQERSVGKASHEKESFKNTLNYISLLGRNIEYLANKGTGKSYSKEICLIWYFSNYSFFYYYYSLFIYLFSPKLACVCMCEQLLLTKRTGMLTLALLSFRSSSNILACLFKVFLVRSYIPSTWALWSLTEYSFRVTKCASTLTTVRNQILDSPLKKEMWSLYTHVWWIYNSLEE